MKRLKSILGSGVTVENSLTYNMENKFLIITPSYNNSDWVEYNLASVLNQTYTNWRLIYIDDNSTDDTFAKASEILKDNPKCRLIKNEVNKGATANYFENLESYVEDPQEIIVHLDGDDWLVDESVLENLNKFYNEKDCWMTYGGFLCYDGTDQAAVPFPQGTEYPDFIHNHKKYREDAWRASHMRTYRGFLMQAYNRNDLKSLIDGEYYWHASDLAFQFPFMEMCPKEKIGVVDFSTYVYNQTKSNTTRTREREDASNHKYEIEIRNRKKYKEGLTGEKLDQINVFNKDYYFEFNHIPKKFTFCYNQEDGEYDMTILCDPAIIQYFAGEFKVNRKVPLVARLFEQREYFQRRIYDLILKHHEEFDAVLTFDRELLKLVPNAIFFPPTEITQFNKLPNPFGYEPYKSDLFPGYEIPDDVCQMYPKSRLVSTIVSSKAFLPGHVRRLEFIKSIRHKIDLYGRGMGREIPSKIDALRDYMFSVAIENVEADDNYFSEKIIDCLITGTIPIYHGCVNIGEFFDMRGILYFSNEAELHKIVDSLTPELYQQMLPYAKENFERSMKWALNNDMAYDMYYKGIIDKGIVRKTK